MSRDLPPELPASAAAIAAALTDEETFRRLRHAIIAAGVAAARCGPRGFLIDEVEIASDAAAILESIEKMERGESQVTLSGLAVEPETKG